MGFVRLILVGVFTGIYVRKLSNKIMEIFDGDELLYMRNDSYDLKLKGNNLKNYSQTSDSAIGF